MKLNKLACTSFAKKTDHHSLCPQISSQIVQSFEYFTYKIIRANSLEYNKQLQNRIQNIKGLKNYNYCLDLQNID